jgi:hypothetical protein
MQTMHRFVGTKRALFLLLVTMLCACSKSGRCAGDITEVTYHITSGPVATWWSEKYVISETGVRLTRGEEAGSEVNAGTWELDVDPDGVALLFEQLEAVKWASIQEIQPEGPSPDGGRSRYYEVKCERDTRRALGYDEGRKYQGGEAVTKPIEDFVASLTLPDDAGRFIPQKERE